VIDFINFRKKYWLNPLNLLGFIPRLMLLKMHDERVDVELKRICLKIELRYQIKFLEIGTDDDHVHFLIQSVQT